MFPPVYLKLPKETEHELLKNANIYFDASALLDLYEFTEITLNKVLDSLKNQASDRLFVTDHNWFEYQKNKNTVLLKPKDAYKNLINGNGEKKDIDGAHLEKISKSFEALKEKGFEDIRKQSEQFLLKTKVEKKHPHVENSLRDKLEEDINKSYEEFMISISSMYERYSNIHSTLNDAIESEIEKINNRVELDTLNKVLGEMFKTTKIDYDFVELMEIVKEGEIRYRNNISPGFEDEKKKEGIQKYGDLISWKQLLDHSKNRGKPAIYVSSDLKPDWVNKNKEPNLELIKEYYDITGKRFWIFSLPYFIRLIEEATSSSLDPTVEEELNTLEELTKDKNMPSLLNIKLPTLQKYLSNEYEAFDFIPVDNYSLLTLCGDAHGNREYVYFYNIGKGNYSSIKHAVQKSLEVIDEYKIPLGDFNLVFFLEKKTPYLKDTIKLISKSTEMNMAINQFVINISIAWLDSDTNVLETVFPVYGDYDEINFWL